MTNNNGRDKMFTFCKFSEMPGFLGYKEVLAEHNVDMGDRMITFMPDDYMEIDQKMILVVLGSKYLVRDFYPEQYNEDDYGPKDPRFVNAKVVHCEALLGYDEHAIFLRSWQWVVVDNSYFNDFNDSAECYWCQSYVSHAMKFKETLAAFNDNRVNHWNLRINVTHRTDSVKWILWTPSDVKDGLERLKS